jgi:hypothetical protein
MTDIRWRNLAFWTAELLRDDPAEDAEGRCRVCRRATASDLEAHLAPCSRDALQRALDQVAPLIAAEEPTEPDHHRRESLLDRILGRR